MKEFSRFLPAVCAALLLQAAALPAMAGQSRQFSLPKTADTEAVGGQIDWPSGKLENWNGPVLLIVPGQRAADRDGWSLLAVGTAWQERSPYQELASALTKKGFAVIRFDAPELMLPSMKCRDMVRQQGLSDVVIAQHCLKVDIAQRASLDMHISSTEYVIAHARKSIPGARQKMVLLALGDDVLEAAAIIDRKRVPVHGFATIGGAASNAFENGKSEMKPPSITVPIPNALPGASDAMAAPIDVIVKRRVPGLFMWGELSNRLSADQQASFAAAANTTVSMQIQRFGGCYHLLSKRSDDDWMEPYMVEQVANTVREFVDKMVATTGPKPPSRPALTAGLE